MASFRSKLVNIFGKVKKLPQNLKFFKLLNGYIPVIFNTNISEVYYNYLMRACLRAIATHVAKADIKHIRYVGGNTIAPTKIDTSKKPSLTLVWKRAFYLLSR